MTFDIESDGLNPQRDRLVLVGYRLDGQGRVKHIWFDENGVPTEDTTEFRKVLANPSILKRGHNVHFDALFLHFNGFVIVGPFECTRVLAYCENPFQDVGLKSLTQNRLKRAVTKFKDLVNAIATN